MTSGNPNTSTAKAVEDCVRFCLEAAAASDVCARACEKSGRLDSFRYCITLSCDCADVFRACAAIAARPRTDMAALKAILRVSAELCDMLTTECRAFSAEAACVEAGQACVRCCASCRQLLSML